MADVQEREFTKAEQAWVDEEPDELELMAIDLFQKDNAEGAIALTLVAISMSLRNLNEKGIRAYTEEL